MRCMLVVSMEEISVTLHHGYRQREVVQAGRLVACFFFFKQKTAYELRISDWSSDVCSSDLQQRYDRREESRVFGDVDVERRVDEEQHREGEYGKAGEHRRRHSPFGTERTQIGSASCRERVCQYV